MTNAFIYQYNTQSLAQFAYYVESKGEAVVVDPIRDVDDYIEMLESRKAKLKYIFVTHFHADFICGHQELSERTGAPIVFGPNAVSDLKILVAKDGQFFQIGDHKIKVIHTPGHTPESSCFALFDSNNNPHWLFTGDTLFLGDVGRPDLAVSDSKKITKQDLASMLFDSLKKLQELPDNVVIYPGHGAGSPCGKNVGTGTHCTLGTQRQNNIYLKAQDRDIFIKELTTDIPDPPQYFFHDASLNKSNKIERFSKVFQRNFNAVALEKFKNFSTDNYSVIDARNQKSFYEEGFIPGSLHIGLYTQFEIWTGSLFPPSTKFLLVTENNSEKEAITRLARIGYDNVGGYLEGGLQSWKSAKLPLIKIRVIDNEESLEEIKKQKNIVLDVRNPFEWSQGVIPNSIFYSLGKLQNNLDKIPKDKNILTLCKAGVRGAIAANLLMNKGFKNVTNIQGGILKLAKLGTKIIPK